MNYATVLGPRGERTYRVSYVYWETRAEPGWEEQLYPDADSEADAAGVEGQTTE